MWPSRDFDYSQKNSLKRTTEFNNSTQVARV